MYHSLLVFHSLFRWLVLLSLLFAIYRSFRGWKAGRTFTSTDETTRKLTVHLAQIQMAAGIWLYFKSPVVSYFLHNFNAAVHERQIRFFGMEHITMMLIAVIVITIGGERSKRRTTGREKFRTMAIWFSWGLAIIFFSIPWEFSPLVSRPYFRGF
jgi:multisubunit Na+/H+ antiporter MnhF subunit